MEFAGKVALITGGGGGIGRASAIGFAGRGAKVVVVDIDATAGEASAELVRQRGGDARFVRADVTKSADVQDYVKATLDAYGSIDCFFNNAGIEGKARADPGIRRSDVRCRDRRQPEGRVPRHAPRPAGDAETGQRRHRQYGVGGRLVRRTRYGALCRVEARRAGSHQGGIIRCRAPRHPGERGVPGPVETRMMRSLEAQRNPNDPQAVARHKRCQYADRPLCDAGGSGQRGDVPVLGFRRRHHRHTHRH